MLLVFVSDTSLLFASYSLGVCLVCVSHVQPWSAMAGHGQLARRSPTTLRLDSLENSRDSRIRPPVRPPPVRPPAAIGKHGHPCVAMVSHEQAWSAMSKHGQPWEPCSAIGVATSKRVLSFLASPSFFLDSSCFRFFILFSFKIKSM